MIAEDLVLMNQLHRKYRFQGPVAELGGLRDSMVANYHENLKMVIPVEVAPGRVIKVPHPDQDVRYTRIHRPWSFIDPEYAIFNPEYGDPFIEDLPAAHAGKFNLIIMVSVLEHVANPYRASDAIFALLKPGGYLFNSTPFLFPYHPSPEDNFRYSPKALRSIHEESGFQWLEGDFHANFRSSAGIGDTNPERRLDPQALMFSYALCRKPENR
jgi:hypothetical protein